MLELIKNLCSIDGVSGNEDAVREYIIKLNNMRNRFYKS